MVCWLFTGCLRWVWCNIVLDLFCVGFVDLLLKLDIGVVLGLGGVFMFCGWVGLALASGGLLLVLLAWFCVLQFLWV